MSSLKLTDYLAIYAAVIASLTFIFQAVSYFKNRSRIKLTSVMLTGYLPGTRADDGGSLISLEVNILNKGKRTAYIEEVGILYYGQGFWHRLNPINKGEKLVLFSQSSAKALLGKQKEMFKVRNKQLSYIAEQMGEKEIAYVKLSSGKMIKIKFKTVSLSQEGLNLDHLEECVLGE